MPRDGLYTIGEVATLTGTTVKTIRHYDRIGLLPPAEVSAGGYRLYSPREIWQLQLALTLRYLGFSLPEIRRVLAGTLPTGEAIAWQIQALEHQIRHLARIREILQQASHSGQAGNSLPFIHDIVEAIRMTGSERRQWIAEKIFSPILSQAPTEWRDAITQEYMKELPEELSPEQAAALASLQQLLADPEFAAEKQANMAPFWNMVTITPGEWNDRLARILERAKEAVRQGEAPEGAAVQALVDDWIGMYAAAMKQPVTPAFVERFWEIAQTMATDRHRRFSDLMSTLNPDGALHAHAYDLLQVGLRWRMSRE